MRTRIGARVTRDHVHLSSRQEQVVRLLERGLTNGQVAEELGISLDGAKFHVTELMNRYGVHSREEAVAAWKQSQRTFGLPLAAPLVWGGVAAGVAVVVVAVAVWVAAGGSGTGDGNAAGAQTATFTMRIVIETPGKPASDGTGTGEIDFKNNQMTLHGPDGWEQVFDGAWHYQKSSSDDEWQKSRSGGGGGVKAFTSAYWQERMDNARSVEDLGEELINGDLARRFRVIADYPAPTVAADIYKDTELHFDVWLAGGRFVQLEQEVTFQNTGDPETDGQRSFMRIEMDNWNEPVDIRIPDPHEVRE